MTVRGFGLAWRTGAVLLGAMLTGMAATLTVQVDPAQVNVGDPVTLIVTVQSGTLGKVVLPAVDGLEPTTETESKTTYSMSANTLAISTSETFHLMARRGGNFTIPAFDVPLQDGTTIRSTEVKLQVLDNGLTPSTNVASPETPPPAPAGPTNLVVAPAGPVILPATNPTAEAGPTGPGNADANAGAMITVPRDKDGGPARVFMIVRPDTTDAYVGQAVPFEIDFYIRMEVNADQNSLPTIKGSDFLMNNFSIRNQSSLVAIEGEQYECDTWKTAISAPKSGDFPLAAERDTYWVKSVTPSTFDPLGFTRHANLAHEFITSNQFTMHVHALPTEGRPEHFTGAIGQFQVSGEAQPTTVAMGEPVTLGYSVRGVGNFDYVRCPVLADSPDWKTYAPSSRVTFSDQAHVIAIKNFEQSAIPSKNGNVPLPVASFSYFDPSTKQYVNVPLPLPVIAVTGAMPSASTPPAVSEGGVASDPAARATDDLLPNRPELGDLRLSMTPAYRQPWFWTLQGGLVLLLLLGWLMFYLRRRAMAGQESAESVSRRHTLRQEENAMAEAVRQGDALAFFVAARHAIQLRLGLQWGAQPEAITLGEVRQRDPQLAESLAPLFVQADEVIYSGRASANLDLAHWDRIVREFLQPQPA